MLPISSPFDTYRVGLWGLRQNLRVCVVYLALMTALGLLVSAAATADLFVDLGTSIGLLLSLLFIAALCMVPAVLIYPLHASFLSDGRKTGFAAIESFGRLWRIGWRLFVIFALALIPILIVLVPVMMGFIDGAEETAAKGGAGEVSETVLDWLDLAATGVTGLFLGISIILFGPHIPDIVTGNDARPGPSSFQRGTRHFWRMSVNLAVGPGLVLLIYYVAESLSIDVLTGREENGPFTPVTLLADLAELCITAFCSAMTAGVLSDAYRRALASEAAR